MTQSSAGSLAVKAVNEYRHRDIFTYLSLRYYLDNSAARSDHWIESVAVDSVLSRVDGAYFRAKQYKDISGDGVIEYRPLIVPGATEALAEAALLNACSTIPLFENPDCVFSYALNNTNSKKGLFQPYINGLRKRHEAIAAVCQGQSDCVVRYLDIKRFYPSVSSELARSAWVKHARSGNISDRYVELGEKLLSDHDRIPAVLRENSGLLVGPMFTHLVANLVLRDLDTRWCTDMPARYFRYVDDITLVGSHGAIDKSVAMLRTRLDNMGLILHDDSSAKNMAVPASEWLEGRNDFHRSNRDTSWPAFVGDLKTLLLYNPADGDRLRRTFHDEGLRIPIPDYTIAVKERHYIERVIQWSHLMLSRLRSRDISVEGLIRQARFLRRNYKSEFEQLFSELNEAQRFGRKRRMPKLRYRASRLVYLADEQELRTLAEKVRLFPELKLHGEVMSAVASRDIGILMGFGVNAAQSAAQPLRAAAHEVTLGKPMFDEVHTQSVAVFHLNGVPVQFTQPRNQELTELMRFAQTGSDLVLMKSQDKFLQQLACLHGLSDTARHSEILTTPFDTDEELTMDAIGMLEGSMS